jgi:hypothetical protein
LSKEHAGGTPEYGFESSSDGPLQLRSIHWGNEVCFAVPIQHFDYTALDDPADHITEAIDEGRDIRPLINQMAAQMAIAFASEAIGKVLRMVYESKSHRNPRLLAVQIGMAAGIPFALEKSGPKWAKQFRISKQAMQQSVERIRKELDLPKTRTMRSEDGRRAMSAAYHAKHQMT